MGEKENQIQRHFPKELILGDLTILKGSLLEHHESATHRKMPPMIKSENSTHMNYYMESATQTKKESVTHMKFVKFL